MTARAEPDTVTMTYVGGRCRIVERSVNMAVDARTLIGTAGYPWAILAANPHLSTAEIELHLADAFEGAYRPPSWLQRKRWMFRPAGTKTSRGPRADIDGKAEQAVAILRLHPGVSIRALVELLAADGIKRGRDWVMRHRCDSRV